MSNRARNWSGARARAVRVLQFLDVALTRDGCQRRRQHGNREDTATFDRNITLCIRCRSNKKEWRRERDSNPRARSEPTVFKTAALNHSAISPCEQRVRTHELANPLNLACLDHRCAVHEWTERIRNHHGPVGLLIVLEHRDQRAPDGESRSR